MARALTPGKLRGIMKLANEEGRFQMMAIDQRGSLIGMLAKVLGISEKEVTYEDVATVKREITRILAPYATAVLTDPVYGYPYSIEFIPRDVGLLLAYEETGADKVGPFEDRVSKPIEGWSIEKALAAGADAIKLLVYYHPDAVPEAAQRQQAFVRQVGELCARSDRPFLLELVSYSRDEVPEPRRSELKAAKRKLEDTPEFARAKPNLVIRSAAEFSKPEYQVDILKLEFPADLKYTEEYCHRVFDEKEREPVYSLKEVREFCRQLNEAAQLPWVILSAGVDIEEFLVQTQLACEAGASGFLCGRAIWKDAVTHYRRGDEEALARMEKWLSEEGVYNFVRANAFAEKALPWFEHRSFGGAEEVQLAGQGPTWYREYLGK